MSDTVRLDKWLWAARFFKTRGLAQQAIRGGKVAIDGVRAKASRQVRVGDRLRVTKGEIVFEVDVEQIAERRVAAPLAREMYAETASGREAREKQIERRRLEQAGDSRRSRRPDKRQRRQLRQMSRKE